VAGAAVRPFWGLAGGGRMGAAGVIAAFEADFGRSGSESTR
jgi:hypothetical protein